MEGSQFSNTNLHMCTYTTTNSHLFPITLLLFRSERLFTITMSEKVKEIATEDFQRAKVLAQNAVRSGAYLYPIKVGWNMMYVGTY
jgi:hypothetical protein